MIIYCVRATWSFLNKTTWDFLRLPCSHSPLASNSALRPFIKMRSANGHSVATRILPSLPHLCEFRHWFFLLQSQDSGPQLTDSLSFLATELQFHVLMLLIPSVLPVHLNTSYYWVQHGGKQAKFSSLHYTGHSRWSNDPFGLKDYKC